MSFICTHTDRCPYQMITDPLPSGMDLPDEPLCEAAAYKSVEGWSLLYRISTPDNGVRFHKKRELEDDALIPLDTLLELDDKIKGDPRREERWLVPIDEYRYAWLGTGSPHNAIQFPAPIARFSDHQAHGGVYVVIRQWVEECPKNKTSLAKLFQKNYAEAWGYCQEHAKAIASSSFRPTPRAKTITEAIRQRVLGFSGLPATPSTARYLLSLVAPDHPEIVAQDESTPTRGIMVTSIGIVGSLQFPDIGAAMIHKMDASSPWLQKDILTAAHKTCVDHAKWWSNRVQDFSITGLLSVNGRLADDLRLNEDVKAWAQGTLTPDQVIEYHIQRYEKDYIDAEGHDSLPFFQSTGDARKIRTSVARRDAKEAMRKFTQTKKKRNS